MSATQDGSLTQGGALPLPMGAALGTPLFGAQVDGGPLLSFSFDAPPASAFASGVSLLHDDEEERIAAASKAASSSSSTAELLPVTRKIEAKSKKRDGEAPLVIPLPTGDVSSSERPAVRPRLLRPVQLENCAEDKIDYSQIPIEDFGAAILRGMGINADENGSDEEMPVNQGRSGLGFKGGDEATASSTSGPSIKRQRT